MKMNGHLIPPKGLDIKQRDDKILGGVYCIDGSSDLRLEVRGMKCLGRTVERNPKWF